MDLAAQGAAQWLLPYSERIDADYQFQSAATAARGLHTRALMLPLPCPSFRARPWLRGGYTLPWATPCQVPIFEPYFHRPLITSLQVFLNRSLCNSKLMKNDDKSIIYTVFH